jgi:hypothetical protein
MIIPGRLIKIRGVEYTLPPLCLGLLEIYQDHINAFETDQVTSKSWSMVINCLHDALKQNYPDMDRSVVAQGLAPANIAGIFKTLMEVSGVDTTADGGKATAGQ